MKFVADFETTTDENDCRVWATALVNIDSVNLPNYGNTLHIENNLESFLNFFKTLEGEHDCYFHNLKFDGSFIIDYLLKHGFTYDDQLATPKTFNTLITNQNIFYQISVRFEDIIQRKKDGEPKIRKGQIYTKPCKIKFKDSLKKIPLKVNQIAKKYGIKEQKTEIDYKMYRPVGYELTDKEKEYITNDVIIVAKALDDMINKQGQTSLTISSDALNDFKHRLANDTSGTSQTKEKVEEVFRRWFPEVEWSESKDEMTVDKFIRNAYKGGYTYCNPKYQGQVVGKGLVYDVNSLYPSRMRDCELPYGMPVYYSGRYQLSKYYPLSIQHIQADFKVKKDHLPTIQLKNNSRYLPTEYITKSDGIEDLYLTNVDLQLFIEHYDISYIDFIDGYKFKSNKDIFKSYIAYWGKIKEEAKTEGERQLAKLMLNSLYGKFASATSGTMKEPFLNEDGVVEYESVEHDGRPPVYTAMACFITAYARDLMIRSAQECYDRFLYCDTDSLHVLGLENPDIEIDQKKLGAWKCEGVFEKAKYLRAKTYLETFCLVNGKMITNPKDYELRDSYKTDVKCAGMPENVKEQVSYQNFELGKHFGGKLMPKTVNGGIILVEREFTIKGGGK